MKDVYGLRGKRRQKAPRPCLASHKRRRLPAPSGRFCCVSRVSRKPLSLYPSPAGRENAPRSEVDGRPADTRSQLCSSPGRPAPSPPPRRTSGPVVPRGRVRFRSSGFAPQKTELGRRRPPRSRSRRRDLRARARRERKGALLLPFPPSPFPPPPPPCGKPFRACVV